MVFDRFLKRKKLPEEAVFSEPIDLGKLQLTCKNVKEVLEKSDAVLRESVIFTETEIPFLLCFINELTDKQMVSEYILQPLLDSKKIEQMKTEKEVVQYIKKGGLYFCQLTIRHHINDAVTDILNGFTVIIFDREKIAFSFNTKEFARRSIEEPSENIVKGSKDSFVESLKDNKGSIRRKIRTYNLVMDEHTIGEQSRVPVAIIYIDGIANKAIVEEVKKKIGLIHVAGSVSVGTVQEALVERNMSVFPQVFTTERADIFCADIIEGRVGILIDGIPVALLVPVTIASFLQAPEDYSQNYVTGSLLRLLRYLLMLVTLLLPGFYISITTFHPEMIPTELAVSIAASKEGVPFPIFVEVMLMLVAFEILIEAGVRLPKPIGQAVSIVGALVVGEAAVNAKFVSPGVVMVIAITAIASYTMPNQDFSNALRVWRFILALLASAIGLFGLSIGGILFVHGLANIESIGVPYLAPFAGTKKSEWLDTMVRAPMKYHLLRPLFLKSPNTKKSRGGKQ